MAEEKQKKERELYEVGEIATQTAPVIVNTKTGETMTIEVAMAKIMNNIERLLPLVN